jgi:hypothetical protein
MRKRKFVLVSILSIIILVIPFLLHQLILLKYDDRFNNVFPSIFGISFILWWNTIAFLDESVFPENSPFKSKFKDKVIYLISGLISFTILGFILFFFNPAELYVVILLFLGIILWLTLTTIFGSNDIRKRLRNEYLTFLKKK